ncbi:MAG: DUF4835 family protein [Candidatus Competibacteraceae bacterium]|nr:DUF4835 family protein [Candidatus Competibacteraceae bacterium]
MKKITAIILLLTCGQFIGRAQELRCNVTVNSNQIAQVDRAIFDALEKGIFEFVNNTRWTDEIYQDYERIECGFFINVTEQEKDNAGQVVADRYKGTLTINARRPIYNTSFFSTLLNYQENDFSFQYIPFQQFYYSENTSMSNLTAIIAFYCYYIIALDHESFSPDGGDKYMVKAQNIVNMSQNIPDRGWKANEGNNNRYWMVNDYLNPAFKPLRELMYNYHRLGFDVLQQNMESGRTQIIESLKSLDKVWTQRPNAFLLQVFFSTKRNEIIAMLKDTPLNAKAELIPVLKKIDPAHASKYDAVNN